MYNAFAAGDVPGVVAKMAVSFQQYVDTAQVNYHSGR